MISSIVMQWEVSMFLYPRMDLFPFDEVSKRIILALEARAWNVPGVVVEFSMRNQLAPKISHVRCIRTNECRLTFARMQGYVPYENREIADHAGLGAIVIPTAEIRIEEDGRVSAFYTNVGRNAELFLSDRRMGNKREDHSRTYLLYAPSFQSSKAFVETVWHPHERAPFLVHTNDRHRECDLEPGDPPFFETAQVLEEFRRWLEIELLAHIEAHPIKIA